MATVLQRDIKDALQRLRIARAARDRHEMLVCERRLNWLLDKLDLPAEKQKMDYEKRNPRFLKR